MYGDGDRPRRRPVETVQWINQSTGAILGTGPSLTLDPTMADVGQVVARELTATDSDGAMAAGSATFCLEQRPKHRKP